MRLARSLTASIAAGVLVALIPLAASAHRQPGRFGGCRIDIASIAPRLITAGEPTEVSGALTCRTSPAAGQPVELYAHTAGTAGFTPVQSTTTETDGAYKFTTAPESANTIFFSRAAGARSDTKRLRVAAAVTLASLAEGSQIQTGAPGVTFTGTVNPADAGAAVVLERQNAATGNEWHRIGFGRVQAGGTFTIEHRFRVAGDASIRVLVRSDGLNVPSESNILEYEISQAQNPNLTISTSADPIAYGQSVMISGALAAASISQRLTLYARTIHERGFAPIAETSTGAGGSYSFPAQTPVNSTLYQVRAGSQRSSVIYEGVRFVLTAEASPTSVQAGQPVSFSGAVAPAAAGHVIYLEAQNSSGAGFHVVQVGRVLADSSYTLVHQFYVAKTHVVRVEIPGGPSNGRAVSQPFDIQVSPAPASKLAPEATDNGTQPSPGQGEARGARPHEELIAKRKAERQAKREARRAKREELAAKRKAKREELAAKHKAEQEARRAKREELAAKHKAEQEARRAKREELAAKHKAKQEARRAKREELAAKRKAKREEVAARRKAEREELVAKRKAEREEVAAKRKAEREQLAAKRKAERQAEREELAAKRKAERAADTFA
jgi:hypothetical protein